MGHHLAWINKPLDCLIGGVPFKYHIMTIGEVPPIFSKLWFINPGLTLMIVYSNHGDQYWVNSNNSD